MTLIFLSLLPSSSQSGQTVSIDAKCDEPTLLGNVLDEIKQTFSQCWLCPTAPGCPPTPPCPPSPKHNIIMLRNTAAGTSSIALFISPQIRKDFFLLTFLFSVPLSVVPMHSELCDHSPDTWCCFTDSLCTCAVFSAMQFHFYLLVFEPQQLPCSSLTLDSILSSCFWMLSALSCAPLHPPLSAIQSVTVM